MVAAFVFQMTNSRSGSTAMPVILHLVIALLMAAVAVTATLVVDIALFLPGWILFLGLITYLYSRKGRASGGMAYACVYVAVMALVVVVAYLAPVKTVDRVFNSHIHLPETTMTLGELQDFLSSGQENTAFPLPMSLDLPHSVLSYTVQWNAKDMSYGQFVEAVESQTPIRHHFLSCGNATTILWGEDPGTATFYIPIEFDQ